MPNKALGQHWLKDRSVLAEIAKSASLSPKDVVLEIGPGLGTLTSELLRHAARVVAVEFDADLARKLPGQFPGKSLVVHNEDFLSFDLSTLPKGYKVVANVPYYITGKIIERLMTAKNHPHTAVLLVQKEVAERIAARPGTMNMLALGVQVYAHVSLGTVVSKQYFTPPPKVDSQVIIITTREIPLVSEHDEKLFFRAAKAGFSGKRKKLRSSIAAGFHVDKPQAEAWLEQAGVSPDYRAEDLSIEQWQSLVSVLGRHDEQR